MTGSCFFPRLTNESMHGYTTLYMSIDMSSMNDPRPRVRDAARNPRARRSRSRAWIAGRARVDAARSTLRWVGTWHDRAIGGCSDWVRWTASATTRRGVEV